MLNRISASALLKSIIALLAALVVLTVATAAWNSWQRLAAADQILDVAQASAYAFTAMHNLRTDGISSARELNGERPVGAEMNAYLHKVRAAEMPALQSLIALLGTIDFEDRGVLLPELQRGVQTLAALQTESFEALAKPKAARRDGLASDYKAATVALLATLEKTSSRIFSAVKHTDALIDQMMTMKQVAWRLRDTGGDASVIISNGFGAGRIAPEVRLKYTNLVGATESAWAILEDMMVGTRLPPRLTAAIANAKKTYFDPDYTARRDRLLNALIDGEKPEMTVGQWTPETVGRLASLLDVAASALDAAKDHAEGQRAAAQRDLIWQLVLLAAAFALALGSMVVVSRRVIAPLRAIQDAMLKVARGDLSADAAFADRRDEIGALAGALGTFKQNAAEKARIEDEQRQRHGQAAARQQAIEAHIAAFETQVRQALDALGGAAMTMRKTSDEMSAISDRTNGQVRTAAQASEEASVNVQTVASASEELSSSIADISRQVSHAADIAGRAVDETRQTDGTVRGLAETAERIGEVVKLINDIAGQTNLLALNATIEAARAGEAGKGFAVVASEVKSLANQTAKATEEISAQIAAIQNVAKDAVEAIKGIGGTIGEVSMVATSIASAVEEQGAATLEITRNTQEAARRTQEVSENVAGVTAGADATGAAAHNVKAAAEALSAQAEQLRGQVTDFLAKIRAA
jgi:methyl-accepting chemotaxis protein